MRRRFDPGVLDRLARIALAQTAGFSLDEIGSMFSPDGRPDSDRRMLSAKADEIDRTIKSLQAVSKSLRHAAVCPAPSHMELPDVPASSSCARCRCARTAPKEDSLPVRYLSRVGEREGLARTRSVPRTKVPPWRQRKRMRQVRGQVGLPWQITPRALTDTIAEPDRAAARRAFEAMMQMGQIGIAAMEAARRG